MAIDKIDRVVLSKSVKNELDSKATKTELNNVKTDLENQINAVVSNMDWKESVATYEDLLSTYPSPEDGWTVNVNDTDITYRYDGEKWIPISANSIPLASETVDGKMSKEDKIKLNTIQEGAQVNPTASEILEALKTVDTDDSGLNANTLQGKTADEFSLVGHNHDGRYYTETEINTLLNGKSNVGHKHDDSYASKNSEHAHENKDVLDKITASGDKANYDLSEFVTHDELESAGMGDMTKGTYDSNNDGIVNQADKADKLTTARTITLEGDASGSVDFDGESDVTLTVTVNDDSHKHTIANIDGLQSVLNDKSDINHTHPYAPSSHTHDDRYFTESEINTKLASKVDGSIKISVGTSAPSSPKSGDIWIDLS